MDFCDSGYCKTETKCAVVLPNCRISTEKMGNISLISQIDANLCPNKCMDSKQNINGLNLLSNAKNKNISQYIADKAGIEESIGNRMTALRLSKNLLAKDIAGKIGFCTSTISRYENNQITSEHADLELLKKYALCCGADKYFLFDGYLIFREFKNCILNEYITEKILQKRSCPKNCPYQKIWCFHGSTKKIAARHKGCGRLHLRILHQVGSRSILIVSKIDLAINSFDVSSSVTIISTGIFFTTLLSLF